MKAYVFMAMLLLHTLYAEVQPQPLVENPVRVPAKVLREGAADTCPSDQDTIDAKNELRQNISAILEDVTRNTICGRTSGWRRVGYLDMTDPSQSCPSGLPLKEFSGLRSCGQATPSNTGGCSSIHSTTLMVSNTAKCVGESGDTSSGPLMAFVALTLMAKA